MNAGRRSPDDQRLNPRNRRLCYHRHGAARRKDGSYNRMKDGFAPGISDEMTITTTPDMGITHLGPGVPSMYSTPSMVSLIEAACVRLVTRYVGPGEQSVGVRIDVKHLAPTTVGKRVTAAVSLRAVNGRRLVFDVAVTNEDGVTIGEGVHERALIDIGRFAAAQR